MQAAPAASHSPRRVRPSSVSRTYSMAKIADTVAERMIMGALRLSCGALTAPATAAPETWRSPSLNWSGPPLPRCSHTSNYRSWRPVRWPSAWLVPWLASALVPASAVSEASSLTLQSTCPLSFAPAVTHTASTFATASGVVLTVQLCWASNLRLARSSALRSRFCTSSIGCVLWPWLSIASLATPALSSAAAIAFEVLAASA